jgi:hypothetical protein
MATFGNTVGHNTNISALATNFKQGSKYTLSEDGTVTKLSLFMRDATGVARAVIYTDAAGSPDALMAVSNEVTFSSSGSDIWVDFPLPAGVPLSAGDYWLGFIAGAGTSSFFYDTVTNNRKFRAETYSATPADPFGGGITTDSIQIQIYATYTPTAAPGNLAPVIYGRGAA